MTQPRLLLVGLLFFGAVVSIHGCEAEDDDDLGSDVEFLTGPSDALPFSEAVRVGNMLYLSGQIGVMPGTMELVDGGFEAESRQTMENIKAVLERHGSSLEDVIKCTVFIDDISLWSAFNEIYVTYFPGHKPARSAFGADGLALGAALEVECLATVQTAEDDDD